MPNLLNIPNRLIYCAGLVVVCTILASSLYFQYVEGFIPCPLCILQRFAFGALGILFFIGILLSAKSKGQLLVSLLSFLAAIAGSILSGRQVWLQHSHVATGNECGVSLQYMLQALPLNEVMQKVFSGSAECTQRGWEFLWLDMPEWALLWFMAFTLLACYLFLKFLLKR